MTDDEPITLKEACQIYHRLNITPSTLMAAADSGMLRVYKMGKRNVTELRYLREWQERCRAEKQRPGWHSIESVGHGLSEMERSTSAQAALNQTVRELRQSLPNISGRSGSPRSHRRH
jgi:hypothetical protein